MENFPIPLELISNLISVGLLVLLFIKYTQYKKKLEIIKGLDELKEQKKLTSEDKEFIQKNLREYQMSFAQQEGKMKLLYPLFILIAGVLLAFLEFAEAMIHLNVLVVAYIYSHVNKLHTKNFVTFLTALNKDLD